MIRMNSIWEKKRNQEKKRYVRVALLGPGQIFGEEELCQELDFRKNRAIVASYSAELIRIPMVKFIGNAPDPQNFYNKMIKKDFKNQWRDTFSKDIIRLTEKKRQESKRVLIINNPQEEVTAQNKIDYVNVPTISGLVNKSKMKNYRTGSLGNITPLD